jgi:hypothetical protein
VGQTVERVEAPSAECFAEEYLAQGRPVLITGVAKAWQAVSWTFDDLRRAAGARRVGVEVYADRHDFYRPWTVLRRPKKREVLLAAFLDRLEQAEAEAGREYLAEVSFKSVFPDLGARLDLPPYLTREKKVNSLVFLGTDTFTPIHYHPRSHGLLTMLWGKKHVLFWPPEQTAGLYPNAWYSPLFNHSRVNLAHLDPRRHPAFTQLEPLRVTVGAGEMLFIPVHWWHAVETPGLGFAVTFAWPATPPTRLFPVPGRRTIANEILYYLPRQALAVYRAAARPWGGGRNYSRTPDGGFAVL